MEEEINEDLRSVLPNTRVALQELENELRCCACHQVSSNLCSLGMCDHLVCSQCTLNKVTRVCPVCELPFNVKDIQIQLPLCNIINISNQLRELLFNPESDCSFDESQLSSKSQKIENEIIFIPSVQAKEEKKLNFENEIPSSRRSLRNSKEKQQDLSKIKKEMPPPISKRKRKSLSNVPSNEKTTKELIQKTLTFKTSINSKRSSINSMQPSPHTDTPKNMLKSSKSTPKVCKKQEGNVRFSSHSTGSPNLSTSSSPGKIKKNAKGETPLHVAVIKGDTEKVKKLLSDGVDVNTKDHAGWTPLHEACNHGYHQIAKLLLDNGALINIPGSENDTPLHDAVMNGRVKCVELLVSRGASLTLRNVHGLMAKDYVFTDVMREAFNTPVITDSSSTNNLQDISSIDGGPLCILGTALNREQKVELHKRAAFLKAKIVEEFNPEVTHIVSGVNKEGMCPRTLKYLKGVLAGKWIVTLDWLRTSEEYGERVSEEPFEVPGTSTNPNSLAPYLGRINRLNQLPRLFDGCQFYFHGPFNYPTPEKEEVIDLVKFGGGHVLNREPKLHSLDPKDLTVPFHAQNSNNEELSHCGLFIIHDNKAKYTPVRHKHMCSAPAAWIMESIASFSLCKLPKN